MQTSSSRLGLVLFTILSLATRAQGKHQHTTRHNNMYSHNSNPGTFSFGSQFDTCGPIPLLPEGRCGAVRVDLDHWEIEFVNNVDAGCQFFSDDACSTPLAPSVDTELPRIWDTVSSSTRARTRVRGLLCSSSSVQCHRLTPLPGGAWTFPSVCVMHWRVTNNIGGHLQWHLTDRGNRAVLAIDRSLRLSRYGAFSWLVLTFSFL